MLTPEELLLANLDTIDRAARFAARRGGLSPADADDLVATVKLALIENDYAALRGFAGRCSLGTYVASIAHRLIADERMQVSGRWRPSAEAKRAGEGAVLLETLVVRDGKPLAEALPLVQKLDTAMTREAAEALLARVPARAQRARLVALDERVPEQEVASETVEARARARDHDAAAARTNAVLRDALAALTADDRVLLRLRFGNGMRVAAIARAWQCEQQLLYRRIETLVRQLRRQLVSAGIDAGVAAQLIGGNDSALEFGWMDDEKTVAVQTISMQADRGSEESRP
ncbi:MAG TPA: sigma-70 family RNA polymerase sigma factor [Thermoanaerobaculia bacterium]